MGTEAGWGTTRTLPRTNAPSGRVRSGLSVVPLADGGADIVLPTLVPGEQLTISYLYFPPVLWQHVNSSVKSDEGMATSITVLPTIQHARWVQNLARALLLVGFAATLYLLIALVRWAVQLLN